MIMLSILEKLKEFIRRKIDVIDKQWRQQRGEDVESVQHFQVNTFESELNRYINDTQSVVSAQHPQTYAGTGDNPPVSSTQLYTAAPA